MTTIACHWLERCQLFFSFIPRKESRVKVLMTWYLFQICYNRSWITRTSFCLNVSVIKLSAKRTHTVNQWASFLGEGHRDHMTIKLSDAPKRFFTVTLFFFSTSNWQLSRLSSRSTQRVTLLENGVSGSRTALFYRGQTEVLGHISLISNSLTEPDRFPSFSCTDGIKWPD